MTIREKNVNVNENADASANETAVTELVFILDRSGSMQPLTADTIGGFNSMLEKQKKESGTAYVTTVLFDTEIERIHDRLPIAEVPELTNKEYFARGCTALIDAVGTSVKHIARIHKYARREDVPDRTLFVIITDGLENASRRYSSDEVKKMIEHEKEKYGWEFLFLGANIDAVETAKHFGIAEERAVNYHSDKVGTAVNYTAVCDAVTELRSMPKAGAGAKRKLSDAWRKGIDKDFSSRK